MIKKVVLFIFSLALIVSCNQRNNVDKIEKRKIDPLLTEIFKNRYPKYKENSLIKGKALSELNKKIDSILPLKYLEDIPLEIFRIQKTKDRKRAIVQFTTDNFDIDKTKTLSNQLQFDIIGLMDENLATTINEKRKYLIYGKKYKRLTKKEIYSIVNQTYFGSEPEISKDIIYSNFYNFNIGVFLAEIDSIKQIK